MKNATKCSGVLIVDRTKPFDLAKFTSNFADGKGAMTIWRGLKDGNGLTGDETQDAASLALTEIDFAKVLFTTCLNDGETSITGEEKLNRHLAAGHIRFDAKIGQCLYEEDGQAMLEWLYRKFGITWFELPGTELRDSRGRRYFLCLFRNSRGPWVWGYSRLDDDQDERSPSAVLEKSA